MTKQEEFNSHFNCKETSEVPSWEDDKIFKCLYLLADEKVIDDVVDRFKTLIRRTIISERKSTIEEIINYIDCEVDCIKSGDKLTPQEQCVGIKALHNVKKRLNN